RATPTPLFPYTTLFRSALRRGPAGDYPPLTENGVQQMVRDLTERAGFRQRITPHTFRHSAATWMLRSGMNPLLVAQVLDHSSLRSEEHTSELQSHLNLV